MSLTKKNKPQLQFGNNSVSTVDFIAQGVLNLLVHEQIHDMHFELNEKIIHSGYDFVVENITSPSQCISHEYFHIFQFNLNFIHNFPCF